VIEAHEAAKGRAGSAIKLSITSRSDIGREGTRPASLLADAASNVFLSL
jgi:hypothetical protein